MEHPVGECSESPHGLSPAVRASQLQTALVASSSGDFDLRPVHHASREPTRQPPPVRGGVDHRVGGAARTGTREGKTATGLGRAVGRATGGEATDSAATVGQTFAQCRVATRIIGRSKEDLGIFGRGGTEATLCRDRPCFFIAEPDTGRRNLSFNRRGGSIFIFRDGSSSGLIDRSRHGWRNDR